MRERVSGKASFFVFKNEGDRLLGKLLEIKKMMIKDVEREVALIEDESGLEWIIILTAGLTDLKNLPILTNVEIIFRGYKALAGGKRFKKFDIYKIIPDKDPENSEQVPF